MTFNIILCNRHRMNIMTTKTKNQNRTVGTIVTISLFVAMITVLAQVIVLAQAGLL